MNNQIIQKAIDIAGGQVKLAEKTGLSQATIHKLLTRKSKGMRLRTAILLSKATGISIEEIIKEETITLLPTVLNSPSNKLICNNNS